MAVYEPRPRPPVAVEAVEVAARGPVSRGAALGPGNFSEYPDWLRRAVEEETTVRWRNCHLGLRVSAVASDRYAENGDFVVLREGRVELWGRVDFLAAWALVR